MNNLFLSQQTRFTAAAIALSLLPAIASATTSFANGRAEGYTTVEFEMPDFVAFNLTGDAEVSDLPFNPFFTVGISRSATYDTPNTPILASGAGTVTLTNTSSVEEAMVRSTSEMYSDIYAEGEIDYIGTMSATGFFDAVISTEDPPGAFFSSTIEIRQGFTETIICNEARLAADACASGDGVNDGNLLFEEWILAPGESRTWTLSLRQEVETILDPAPTTVVPLPAPALLLGMTVLGGLALRRRG